VPEEAGDYEIRYLAAVVPYKTLASKPLSITPVLAELTVPTSVIAGSSFSVTWKGPNNPQDFITIVKAGTPVGSYAKYVYSRKGSPLQLRAPEEVGEYEVRYLTGHKYFTLAAAPIRVEGTTATLSAPASVQAGAPFEVTWTGPDNHQDYVTIVEAEAKEGSYNKYVYTSKGSPLTLPAPEVPGAYEVRYLTGEKGKTLANAPIRVVAVSASLNALESVRAGETFQVKWTGPDNPRDFISMILLSEPENEWPVYTYTHHGSPADLTAPLKPGDYELRYRTGHNFYILASRAIRVEPTDVAPGRLEVLNPAADTPQLLPEGTAVELILDASGSMLQRLSGKRRIDIAKEVLVRLVNDKLEVGTPFALRVFGHREVDSCRTDLELPLGPLDKEKALALIKSVDAKNKAKTPIGASLEKVAQDLARAGDQHIVLLVTDGEETCDGDPAAAIEALQAAGMNVRINIIGFAIDDMALKQTFRLWANLGGGSYFDAGSAEALDTSLTIALKTPFDVLNPAGETVGEGLVSDTPIDLPAGTYRIRTRETNPRMIKEVTVLPGKLTSARLK